MEIKGKLIHLLPLQSGEGKNGIWKKQDIVIETTSQFPKKVCISVWGDKINPEMLKIGNHLTIQFDIESREYNAKWYTDIKAWKVEMGSISNENVNNDFDTELNSSESKIDDLPF